MKPYTQRSPGWTWAGLVQAVCAEGSTLWRCRLRRRGRHAAVHGDSDELRAGCMSCLAVSCLAAHCCSVHRQVSWLQKPSAAAYSRCKSCSAWWSCIPHAWTSPAQSCAGQASCKTVWPRSTTPTGAMGSMQTRLSKVCSRKLTAGRPSRFEQPPLLAHFALKGYSQQGNGLLQSRRWRDLLGPKQALL